MFEGFVSQVLLGYLGRYVKGIQKDQLKIWLWREEVLLEKVELILEAFDYLQLPFALKTGQVGKLSIKVPWKKLGWEPIVVALEDVFICSCRREDNEWSLDSVERRELAGKMAKLNAIELAKFSRRVSDNPAGQSFLSFIYAKILDNIQVSIKNVHIVYIDSHNNKGNFVFGLRFSSLTIMTDNQKQSAAISTMGKSRGGQVNKNVEISNIGLYCNLFEWNPSPWDIDGPTDSQLCCNVNSEPDRYDYLVNPFDVSISLVVNKTGKTDGAPQYAIFAELTTLVLSLNEVQLEQILILWDYFSICSLREKYGRYRPPQHSLSQKLNGWQIMWWHYAQESVLADVRRKLRKTSWSYFGRRISQRRRYVNLYKRKLILLQQQQPVNKDILTELEKMDKECDIDDILNFRCVAEQELQDFLKTKSPNVITIDLINSQEKQQILDQSGNRERGWLNWLSLGMLGAGGTADSNSFAGVVSDEIIKDIYDATEFHPVPSSGGDSLKRAKICSFSIKLNVFQILSTISIGRLNRNIANAIFDGIDVESKVWEDSVAILASIGSVQIVNPCDDLIVLMTKKAVDEESSLVTTLPFVGIQVNILQPDQVSELSVKVMLQPFEVTFEPDFFQDLMHFCDVLASFQFQHNRVLHALNGLGSFKARLLSKTEYISLNHKKINWDVSLQNAVIKLPLESKVVDYPIMAFELGGITFKSCVTVENYPQILHSGHYDHLKEACLSDSIAKVPLNLQLQDLYDHYIIELTGFEVYMSTWDLSAATSIIEKLDVTIGFGLCIFFDEPLLKALEVDCFLPTVGVHLSPTVLSALIGLHDKLLKTKYETEAGSVSDTIEITEPDKLYCFQFSSSIRSDQVSLSIGLEEGELNSSVVNFTLRSIDFRHSMQEYLECYFYVRFLKAEELNSRGESTNLVLSSPRSDSRNFSLHEHVEQVGCNSRGVTSSEDSPGEGCFNFKYHAQSDGCIVRHECRLCLNDVDVHIHPRVVGLLHEFFNQLSKQPSTSVNSFQLSQQSEDTERFGVEFLKLGFDDAESATSCVDQFPFVNICNSGLLGELEGSFLSGAPESQSSFTNDRHHKIGTFKFQENPRTVNEATIEYPCSTGKANLPKNSNVINMFFVDIDLDGLRAHFHDSSCILGTITLPKCRSSIIFKGNDCWDAQISTEGVMLCSSWSPPNIRDQLWGPAATSISPILNIHLRKQTTDTLFSTIEVSFGVRHVCCILPSSYLAMLIGYFALPDWTYMGNENEHNQYTSENKEIRNVQREAFLYKFEILQSRLILPVESQTNFFLQLGLSQLFLSFILTSSIMDADKDIPSCCAIPANPNIDKLDIFNVFGRNISVLLIPLMDDTDILPKSDECCPIANVPLIEELDADLWIRIPCTSMNCAEQSSLPTLIMMKAYVCNLIAEDKYLVVAVQAVGSVVDELSSIVEESKYFRSDVLQFLQTRKSLKKMNAVNLDSSNSTSINVKLCAEALSIKFSHFWVEQSSSEMVAKADLQLNFSASLVKGILQFLDFDISGLVLHSIHNNLPLASFVSDSSLASHLYISFSQSAGGKKELLCRIPFLDIWLHFPEWNNFFEVFSSYTSKSDSTCPEPQISSNSASEYMVEEDDILIIISENSAIAVHLPIWDKEEYCSEMDEAPTNMKYIKVSLQSRCFEFTIGKTYTEVKCNMEKVRAILEMIHGQNVSSIPFVQISQIKLETKVQKQQAELLHAVVEVQIESLDVGLSYQIFNFLNRFHLKLPNKSSSSLPRNCMVYHVHLRKGSLLLSDGRWSYHGPIFEILTKNILVEVKQTRVLLEGSANAEIVINYNNIDKVMWEPFVEPCHLQLKLVRNIVGTILLNTSAKTDIYLESTEHLNLNITEPLIEAIFRVKRMIDDVLKQCQASGLQESHGISGFFSTEDIHTRRYAPYILQNDTSLPFRFHVSRGSLSSDDICGFLKNPGNVVQPGHAVPIYVEETVDEQHFRHRTAYSSERLIEKKMNAVSHHMISIHLEGTTGFSKPMSMDLVGRSYFEVNFSNSKQSDMNHMEMEREDDALEFNRMTERFSSYHNKGLVVPVVFEVSMQHYSKMIRLYSTVILFNATEMPLELRFDIPFGVSPKVLDPILPGHEIPLPLHLAEAGRIRWRPVGNNYLWSEAHSLSNILSQEYRLGFLRSFVCYPAHPSSDPFRCCISIQDYSLSPSSGARKHSSLGSYGTRRETVNAVHRRPLEPGLSKKHLIRQVRLTTPFLVKNYLPVGLSLMIESSGVTHSISVKEVNVASVFLVDSTNDLGVTFLIQGYRPIVAKFPRAESFSSMAKLTGSKYYLSETLSLYPETSSGPTYVIMEKAVDASSGAREICLYVSFLLYNCTGLVLAVADGNHERRRSAQVIPSSYHLIKDEHLFSGKQGLSLLSSEMELISQAVDVNTHTISIRERSNLYLHKLSTRHFPFPFTYRNYSEHVNSSCLVASGASISSFVNGGPEYKRLHYSGNNENGNDHMQSESSGEVKPYMYCPFERIPASEFMVKLCAHMPQSISGTALYPTWSSPFPLVPASGSVNVVIPKPNGSGAFLVSATSVPVVGELSGRTKAITFQPRYVICNACKKDLCYKQKGTSDFYHLGVGQHSHLHWSDTSRDLHVSIRFNEPGWEWSGSFLPDFLGDVQVKVRNYVSGTSHMVRVEVQNADFAIGDNRTSKTANANSSTQLILLSDDNSGFMPYRIDNFSMERLRVYQQRCEFFETVIHAYTTAYYAWDEPCYPHRLVVEVPGERILGTYTLDSIQEYLPVHLPSTSEKAERKLYVSVHAEGAVKVLSIIDSNYHMMKDMKDTGFLGFKEKKEADQKQGVHADFNEVVTLHLPFVGISLISSSPQELIFACARETVITVMQSVDQQKVSFQILALQIDNQLSDSPYPIVLSFDNDHKGRSTNFLKNKEHALRIQTENTSPSTSECINESVFYFTAAKWRNVDASLVSFKYINFRLAPLCIEIEEQVLLSFLDFLRVVSSRLEGRNLQENYEMQTLSYGAGVSRLFHANIQDNKHIQNGLSRVSKFTNTDKSSQLLPSVIPIGTPWQQICLSARRQKKIYVEVFELAPIKLSLSFTSTPWMIRNEAHAGVETLAHISSTTFQRSLMALVDVEGVPVHLGELILGHLMASHESIEEIVTKHYTRQLLHEMYKVFGSAGVIGNPIGFARNVGLGIRAFLSVSSKEVVQSPIGLLNGIAQGSKSLLSNTVYAISSATTQFTKTAHKGIVAFTFDEQAGDEMEHKFLESHGKGILSEFLEGLTGLLQSPVRGAEKHGLPGVLSGIAMGTAGLVARPMASILEATGKTAQSIRKRSSPHQSNRFRIRFPRPLARELPLLPYSWEEAIGVSMLLQADGSRLKEEVFVMCKALKQSGKFIIISERLVFSVWCSCLVNFGSLDFVGVAIDPEWVIETEMTLESIVHIDRENDALNIVGSNAETASRQKKMKDRGSWKIPSSAPLFCLRVEFRNQEEAEDVLQVLLSTIDLGKERRWGAHVLLRSNLR